MKILIVSDAWHPQINGVVRTLEITARELERMGHQVVIHGPDSEQWHTVSAPSYPSIKLELLGQARLGKVINHFLPDIIHIATEGPLGWAARRLCLRDKRAFTTAYHTRFPEYLAARAPFGLRRIVAALAYALMRRFHAPAQAVMVATASIEQALRRQGFNNLIRWSRGVDTDLFTPAYGKDLDSYNGLPRPILLNVGRVAVEKNLRAFLDAKVIGTKMIIGDGPDLARLKAEYPTTHFLGAMEGEKLARHYAAADIFVFPSATDTFGLVLLEAAASGLRIASLPAPGPVDLFDNPASHVFAVMDADLTQAIRRAATLPPAPQAARHFAEGFSWATCTETFLRASISAEQPN